MTGKSTLNLLTLDDGGLAKLYDERVAPILQSQEAKRVSAMRTYITRAILGGIGSLGVVAIGYAFSHDVINALIFGALAFAGAHWFAYLPLQDVATNAKSQSLTAIADAIGCTFQMSAFDPAALPKFQELHLLPSCDRSDYSDCFTGSHHGCAFAFYEGHLEDKVRTKNGEHWKTVFRGQLIRIAFPKKFLGTTIVRRDAGFFNFVQRWMSSLQRVGLSDSRLEKAFEVYSNDQVEARYLIHPVFMERLLELEACFQGKNLRCAFSEGDLLVAVEGGDKFEVGTMFLRLDDIARARSIVADLTEIMRVIDAVLTAELGALPAGESKTGPASPSPLLQS
jgi:hypothetical protein